MEQKVFLRAKLVSLPLQQRNHFNHIPDATHPYQSSAFYPLHEERWFNEREQNYRNRDRRLERRPQSSHLHPIHSQRNGQQSIFGPGYMTSADLTHPSFQSSYTRPPEMQSMSTWANWEMTPDPNLSLGHIRRLEEKSMSWTNPVAPQIPSMDSHHFNNMLLHPDSSASPALYTHHETPIPLNGFNFPHRLSPLPSPTPSPVQEDVKPTIPHRPNSTQQSRRKASEDRSDSGKSCSHCHATSTPLWRRDPSTMKPLCNACGLYLQQRNKLRPQELIDADDDGSSSEESDANYLGPECSHCRTHRTSVWRRSKSGDQLCNACGVYARLRGKPRPLSLKKNKIRPRSKHSSK